MVRSYSLFLWLSTLVYLGLGLSACSQRVQALSAADQRLPNEAKQNIADAEDAVLIAQSRVQDAQNRLEQAQIKQIKFTQSPPDLGSAKQIAGQLYTAQTSLAQLNLDYANVNLNLSRARLALVYAQTSMRYDIAVYDLKPMNLDVEKTQRQLLQLRKEKKLAQSKMKTLVEQWWTAYQGLAKTSGTQGFWVHEFKN